MTDYCCRIIDLHTHSNASDGYLSPALLIQEAVKKGLMAIALTDHDTLGGLEIADASAKEAGICFIPGVEISISWMPVHESVWEPGISGLGPGGEFHLLGLGIRAPSKAFLETINELSCRRDKRNHEILDRMHELSIEASWEDIISISGGPKTGSHSIGRPHFATLLVKKKIVKNHEQAFARFLSKGKPLYVPKAGLDFEDACTLIRGSGGIPVLAHPMSLYVAWGRLPGMIKHLKDRGLMGIEAWHPVAKAKSCRRLEELGKSLGLYITEGSDFHGLTLPGRELGVSHRGRRISKAVLDAIPELNQSINR